MYSTSLMLKGPEFRLRYHTKRTNLKIYNVAANPTKTTAANAAADAPRSAEPNEMVWLG